MKQDLEPLIKIIKKGMQKNNSMLSSDNSSMLSKLWNTSKVRTQDKLPRPTFLSNSAFFSVESEGNVSGRAGLTNPLGKVQDNDKSEPRHLGPGLGEDETLSGQSDWRHYSHRKSFVRSCLSLSRSFATNSFDVESRRFHPFALGKSGEFDQQDAELNRISRYSSSLSSQEARSLKARVVDLTDSEGSASAQEIYSLKSPDVLDLDRIEAKGKEA